MHFRPLRLILLCTCLLVLASLSSVVAVRATTPASHSGHSFRPGGHGSVTPRVVDTATIPQLNSTNPAGLSLPPAPASSPSQISTSHPLLGPTTVVNVPPPTSTDPTARYGISTNQPKPDANGAGGTYNYFETVNGAVAIYNRSGGHISTSSYQVWFGLAKTQFVDPVTQWDSYGSRFLFSILQIGTNTLWLSVAQQASATGKFCNYSFTFLPNHDFDKLGVDSDGIYFSANLLSSTGAVDGNELFFTSRTALESCQTATYTNWTNLTNPDGTLAEAITPARQDSSANGVEYLVNSYPAGACQLTLWALTSSGTLSNTSIPTQCYSPPTKAKQLGSAALIDTGDCSITQASLVNGLLTVDMSGSYDFGDGNGPVGIVEWYVLNPSTASVSSQGAFGTPGYWLFYPSAITTANGHMLFVYNASGASIYPSVWYVNQTMTGTTALANGVSYDGTSGSTPWGDYQSAWPDATGKSRNSVWITGESVKSTNAWGTRFDLVTP
jgi:hypothetical protein